jgi:hypothetical protein
VKRNKHTKKNCAPDWLYLQDYKIVYSAALNGVLPFCGLGYLYRSGENYDKPKTTGECGIF